MFYILIYYVLVSLLTACGSPNIDPTTSEERANKDPELSNIYVLGELNITADGEETTETFSGKPKAEILPLIATGNLKSGKVVHRADEVYQTIIEVLKTGDFRIEIDFEAFRKWLQEKEVNINEIKEKQDFNSEKVDFSARMTFDTGVKSKEANWLEAKRAQLFITSIQPQSEVLRIRGLYQLEVINEVQTPLIEFRVEIEFETERGHIQIEGDLGGYLSRWEGSLTSDRLK